MIKLKNYIHYIFFIALGMCFVFQSNTLYAKKKIRKIVIDAGHGGKDPGCHGMYSNEKDITLAVAKKVGKMIQDKYKDVKVIYTRDSDVFAGGDHLSIKESLIYRTEVANREKADLFISIHVNSTPRHNSPVKGTLVLVCGPTRVEEKEEAIGVHTENIAENEELLNPGDPATQIIIAQYSQAFLAQSIVLASKINDGAAAMVLMSESEAKKRNIKPLVKILSSATFAQDPKYFTTAPVGAIKKALEKANLKIEDIDAFEINEAFAAVALRFIKDMGINDSIVNVNGGAIAMGHPLGATGCMILGTLMDELERRGLKRGLATLCVGGGMGIATIIELV